MSRLWKFWNFKSFKGSTHGVGIFPEEVVLVSGIGQAAKLPHYIITNVFNGLHGRSIPVALAVKTKPRLLVIAESGDGCMYGEGGNHFLHALRNPDITVIVHNNQVYGWTRDRLLLLQKKDLFLKLSPGAFISSFKSFEFGYFSRCQLL